MHEWVRGQSLHHGVGRGLALARRTRDLRKPAPFGDFVMVIRRFPRGHSAISE